MRKPGSKNTNRAPDREQQVTVIAQENLKLASFLFHHRWRCTFDLEVTGVHEDSDMLAKVNNADIAGTMEAIEENIRSCHGVIRAPIAYVIRKTILVKTYGDYSKHATPNNEMITKMLH